MSKYKKGTKVRWVMQMCYNPQMLKARGEVLRISKRTGSLTVKWDDGSITNTMPYDVQIWENYK